MAYLFNHEINEQNERIFLCPIKLGVIVILQAEICKFCTNSQIAGSNFGRTIA